MRKKVSLLFLTAIFTLLFSMAVMAAPAKVNGLKQTGASTTSIKVEYNAVLGSSVYYEIQMSTDGSNYITVDSSHYGTSHTESSLTSGTTYWVRVRAKDGTTYGAYSDAIQVTTACENVENLRQTGATTSSVTIAWNKVSGATGYRISKWVNNQEYVVGTTTKTTYTLTGFSNKSKFSYYLTVRPLRTVGNYTAEKNTGFWIDSTYLSAYDVKLVPQKANKPYVTNWWTASGSMWMQSNAVAVADGYTYEIYNSKGTRVSSGQMSGSGVVTPYVTLKNINRNQFYKMRVRAYNTVGNKKYYGAWSDYYYASNGTKLAVKWVKKNRLKVTWNKVKGATGYTVYISDSSYKSGFKKVAKTKKTTVSLTKFKKKKLNQKKTYYIKVVANKKVGKTTYKSGGNDVLSANGYRY